MSVLFAAFDVTRQVFFRSSLSVGIVNLKPLLPGHVLILPRRVVPRLSDLTQHEVTDLFTSVQRVGGALESIYKAQALTVSLQDGLAAGQTVPHVHVHLIPRHTTDYEDNKDQVYADLEENERGMYRAFSVPNDADRQPRTLDEMEKEAKWLEGRLAEIAPKSEPQSRIKSPL